MKKIKELLKTLVLALLGILLAWVSSEQDVID